MVDTTLTKNNKQTDRQKRVILAAARHIVNASRITECAMEPGFGFKGTVCPVINCYARCPETGKCVAGDSLSAKATSKAMRDAINVVEIITAAREAPEWAEYTVPVITAYTEFDEFIKEAGVSRNKLQFVLDNNQVYLATMESLLKLNR